MKKIQEILSLIKPIEIIGTTENKTINSIHINSQEVKENSLFIAIKGTNDDGHKYINDAIKRGAKFIICEKVPLEVKDYVTYIIISDTKKLAGQIAAAFYNFPSNKIKVIGITGTNGKTTIATLLYQTIKLIGKKAGLISTINNYVDNIKYSTNNTTPGPIEIQRLLNEMLEQKCEYCFMEVSSHALDQHRINGINFTGAVFTNITHEHLDYHKSFENYLKTKKILFDILPENSFALTNVDDKNGLYVVQNSKANIYTYGLKTIADFNAKILEKHLNGTLIKINNKEIWIKLIGSHNVYNILAVYATLILLGFNEENFLNYLSILEPVNGRLEVINYNNKYIFIDYAHTPDALKKVLETLNEIKSKKSKIIVVIGAGGNRDKSKRPIMAKIASTYSSFLILTSDNPRFEDPEQIINEMKKGLSSNDLLKTICIIDRKEAIKTAINLANTNDLILIAGKGHENYQEINGIKYPFNDKNIVLELLNKN